MIEITIDNKHIQTKQGKSLLQVCLDNGIYIPNLCYIHGIEKQSASCRLCFVEIQGDQNPVTACTVNVFQGMVVKTDSEAVRKLQRTGFELLLSVHHVDCKNCHANKKCELQKIAKFLKVGLKSKQFELDLKDLEINGTHPFINYYTNRCVLCGKCIYACSIKNGKSVFSFAGRGFNTVISSYDSDSFTTCEACTSCIEICPVGALARKT